MKKKIQMTVLLLLVSVTMALGQEVGIGTETPDGTSILELKSPDKGFLPPRMTATERNTTFNGANPAPQGMVIYNLTVHCLEYWDTTKWINMCDGSSTPTGIIAALDCSSAVFSPAVLTQGASYSGTLSVSYTGGNSGTYVAQNFTVNGLTFTLAAGSFTPAAGNIVYNISGAPAASGNMTVPVSVGGRSCNVTKEVGAALACGGPSTVTFTYDGSPVTYGVVESPTGRCWLDRNLGASRVATSSTDTQAYGDLYQWGRSGDGHQKRTSGISSVLSNSDIVPSPNNDKFITTSASPNDWRSPQNDTLWQGVSGTNNPCPSGYRIPTDAEWTNEVTANNITTAATAFASPLKITISGGRSRISGAFENVGGVGVYWTSTIIGTNVMYRSFFNASVNSNSINRSNGISVRCIRN